MIFIAILFFILVLVFIALFAFPKLSPIPYFPSQKIDLPLIIKSLGVKNNQVIMDLGAGDGLVIFEAAKIASEKHLNTRFIALEINPILYLLLRIKNLFHRNRKNIQIVFGDMFKIDYKNVLPKVKSEAIFYLYISPWFLEKISSILQKQLKNFYIISYMYAVPKRKEVSRLKGKNNVFRYKFMTVSS